MELSDAQEIAAARSAVWDAILTAEVLKACIPGCKELTGSAADGFDAVVVQKVGPVKATFKGTVTLSDIVEGESLTLTGEGKGGAAGFAKGGAVVTLRDAEDGGTLLSYDMQAKVGGKLAQLGSRIIDGFTKKMAAEFFDRFKTVVEGGDPDAPENSEGDDDAKAEAKPGMIGRLFGRKSGGEDNSDNDTNTVEETS